MQRRAIGIAQARSDARDVAARAGTGIDEAVRLQRRYRAGVIFAAFALPARRLGKGQAEPGEIFDNGRLEFCAAAGKIDVFDAQQEASVDR